MTADLDALAEEAVETPEERLATVTVQLVDTDLDVLPATEWRSSAIHAIHIGDFDTWAAASLTEESWEIWQEIDPTTSQIAEFFQRHRAITRESLGKSDASRRSSKRTARR